MTRAQRKAEQDLKSKVLAWMRLRAEHHDNATSLAEDAAHNAAGDNDAWLDDEQHWVWDMAIQVMPGE